MRRRSSEEEEDIATSPPSLTSRDAWLVVLPSSVSYITAEYLCSSPPPSQPTGLWL